MALTHHLSTALRAKGYSYAADELDRLLTALGDINHEIAENQGSVSKATQYQLTAMIIEQSAEYGYGNAEVTA